MLTRGAILLTFVPASVWFGSLVAQEQLPTPRPSPGVRSSFVTEGNAHRYLGPATCASANCHNGPRLRGGEYAVWVEHDRHAQAWHTLRNEKSRQIMKNLYGSASRPAERETLCLQCHVMPNIETAGLRDDHIVSEGVSCEACHGPAEHWLSQHHKSGWRGLSAAEKQRRGMRDTASISGRAESCVACHVGAPGMEVNHDLIAAGHPPLNFEFSAFHALMPHHWPDRNDKDPAFGGRSDFEARAWMIGQSVCARAALELLAHRASNKSAPWPEFAEYECASCHQQLRPRLPGGAGLEPLREKSKRRPGSLPYSQWYHAETDSLAGLVDSRQSEDLRRALSELDLELGNPNPERDRVAALAKTGVSEHAGWQSELQRRVGKQQLNVPQLFTQMTTSRLAGDSWSLSAQRYLGLAALHHAWKDADPRTCPPELAGKLRILRSDLDGPNGYSPRSFRLDLNELNKALRP